MTALYFLLPDSPETKLVLYNGTALLAVVGVVVGVRRNRIQPTRPWMWCATGLASFVIGDICYYLLERVSDGSPPFPSIADAFYLTMYPLMIIGLTSMLRRVAPDRSRTSMIDALVVGIAIFGILWVLFVDTVIERAEHTTAALITQLAYPVMDVALLAVAARLVVVLHMRHKPYALIVGSIASLAVADIAYGIYNTQGLFKTGLFIDLFWLGFYVQFGIAALHPSASRPALVESDESSGRLTGRQLAIMFVASLSVPLVDLFWGVPQDRIVTIGASALLFLLILLRVLSLTRALERGKDRLHHEATHDSLTGLANRTLFVDRTAAALRDDTAVNPVAVLFIDLDDFKTINDSLGHQAGDELLVEASARLQRCVRDGDMVARLGGDEFAVLLRSAVDRNDVVSVARRVLDTLESPMQLTPRTVSVSCSIGIAIDLDESTQVETLLRNADVAMYLSKARGKGRFEFFESTMHEQAIERLDLKADLARALESQQFLLHYQPVFDLESGRVVLAEALLRWKHPLKGMIAPDRFIPLAEESGLIVPIGAWVLQEACKQASRWHEIDGCENLAISVNLSMRQIQDNALINTVTAALKDSGIEGRSLILEITESMLAHDTERTTAVLQQLKTIGVKLAIDDFGTGYSSLSHLRTFPVDKIKIDKTFIRELHNSPTTEALIEAVVNLAKALGATTVAEGIESREQAEALRRLHCDRGQGFYYCRPLPSAALATLLREHHEDEIEPLESWRRASESAQRRVFDYETRTGLADIRSMSFEVEQLTRSLGLPLMGSWPWLRNWAESFESWTPTMIGVRSAENGNLVACALLATIDRAETTAIVAMGHGSSLCSLLPASDPEASLALADAVAGFLNDLPGAWSLDLEQLPELDSTMLALAGRLENVQVLPELRVPRVLFAGTHRVETVLSKNMRKQIRRAQNRINAEGLTMSISFDRGRAITEELIDEVEAVHVSRDRVSRRQSDLDRPAEREFWRRVVEGGLDHEWEVEIATLRLDGIIAAYVVALLDGECYRVYDGRMNTAYEEFSPGRLVESAALNRALLDPRFRLLDWMSGVAAEKLLTANHADGRARLVATSGSRFVEGGRKRSQRRTLVSV
jgi:diguanylate cyclase (GGDEF)-like protein